MSESREKNIDAQIQAFYDNVPHVDDDMPLKEYLTKHEDSRMAWYLLGKQYESKGDESKALYCFGQAGEIYEAFEGKPNPGLKKAEEKRDRGNRVGWYVAAGIFALLLGIGFPIVRAIVSDGKESEAASSLPSGTRERAANVESDGRDLSDEGVAGDGNGAGMPGANAGKGPGAGGSSAGSGSTPGLIAAAAHPDGEGLLALGQLLTAGANAQPLLLVDAPHLGRFSDWVKGDSPVAAVTTASRTAAAASTVNWYDPRWCNCKPDETGGTVTQTVNAWKPVQEEKLAFVSAVARYKAKHGRYPASPKELNGDYPNNTIAGWSDEMTGWLNEINAGKLVDGKADELPASGVPWPMSATVKSQENVPQAAPGGDWRPLTELPLEIVIDKTRHRLAVVSGSVLIRNYEVGLGGDLTPEGDFVISEKVREPNGRTDGPFGSRGMTLSDTRYGIHGTDEPTSIGKDESHGCVRMKKADLEELFDLVPLGTKVTISKGGLPVEIRAPKQRFVLSQSMDETNPHKKYDWLD